MGTNPVRRGPVGARCAVVVRQLRVMRGWSLETMAQRLHAAGYPMSGTCINKIENRDRRMDVDDLVAFATAFEIEPGVLLQFGPAQVLRAEADRIEREEGLA